MEKKRLKKEERRRNGEECCFDVKGEQQAGVRQEDEREQ